MRISLLQSATFADNASKKGIDSILSFSYMGKAEFEFGALPQSLKRIRENKANYDYFEAKIGLVDVTIYCNTSEKDSVIAALIELIDCKHVCYGWYSFSNFVLQKEKDYDLFWAIDYDFLVWRKDSTFESKFKQLI